jgi:hypothetical protein
MDKESESQTPEKSAYQAFDELFRIQFETWKHIADVQMKFVNLWQDYLNSSFQRVPNARTFSDLVAIESGLTAEYGNKFSEYSKEAMKTISEAQKEMMSRLEEENLMAPVLSAAQNILEQGEQAGPQPKSQGKQRARAAQG